MSRHLPETDLANYAFLPVATKEARLLDWLKPRKITRSYEPFRQNLGDTVNAQLPLLEDEQTATTWSTLENLVAKKCGADEILLKMNLAVAKATHSFAVNNNIKAEKTDVRSLTLVHGHPYDFSMPLLLRYDGRVVVAFTDLRRTGCLSVHAQRVVFSILHERFRVNFPGFERLGLEVWKYANTEARTISAIRHGSEPLYSYEELQSDFTETYDILNQLMRGLGRPSQLGPGPLFGNG